MSMDLQLQSVFDSLDDGIVVLDEDLKVVWLNTAGGRILGCDAKSVVGQSARSCSGLEALIRQLELETWSKGTLDSRRVQRLEVSPLDREKVRVEAVLTIGQMGDRRVVTAVMRDISAQERMEKAIYDSRKSQAVGALASGIAHDFNNILTAIISQIDLVLYSGELPGTLRQNLVYAQTSARRGAELVGKLQAFSHEGRAQLEAHDLGKIVDHAIFVLRRSVDPLIQIESPQAKTTFPVKADANQLTQVIWNLAINARDAMPKGGRITFRLESFSFAPGDAAAPRRAGDFVRLTVEDTGSGMSPEVLGRAFEPYFSTKDSSRGPGLGLSIASAVVNEHGGWIEVASREGAGTQVSIFLPRGVEEASVQAVAPPPDPSTRSPGVRERILVVDDEELVRLVTKAVLAYRGYQIFEAVDGEEAIQKYAESSPRFDLVLMDLHMPRLNGYDALTRIRQIEPAAKAILLSGGAQDPSGFGVGLEGVVFLQKPFDNAELANVVRQLLDGKSP